ncbi:AAA family ATPase [Aquibaculum sediminis]|uniref:AAA family ATPase n=1 Tax=Aquibaculum sediminis TaxID=3231907 RepID=UPI0034545866
MRINELSFDLFGHFSAKSFDFGKGGQSDFHIIHGPNESGKTTTMEGFLRLLYGFPLREPYDFKHQRKNLCVSGVLEMEGQATRFKRLSTRAANLLDASGKPVPEQALAAHLGGLSEEDYRSLLCLDDDTIEKGGEDIANARGDIGRLLFSAAAGISDLNAVLEQIRDETQALYRKRASTTRLAELKRELRAVEERIRDTDVSASALRKLKLAFQAAERDEAAARKERDTLRRQRAEVAALSRSLPLLTEHDRLAEEIAGYTDYPERIDINPEDLITLKTDQVKLEAEIARLKSEVHAAETEFAEIEVDAEQLSLGDELDRLDELRSRMTTAGLDLPRRRRTLEEAQSDMIRTARELGTSDDACLSGLVRTAVDIETLEEARDAMRDAASAREAEQREVAALQQQVEDARKACDALTSKAPRQTGLIELLARYEVDSLAAAVAKAHASLAGAEEQLEEALAALSTPDGAFTRVPACPMDPATAQELAEEHTRLTEEANRASDALTRYREEEKVKSSQIAELEASMGVAGEEDAEAARNLRDSLWRAHRETLTIESADAFEPAMARVDDIAASRFGHARELGQLRQLKQAHIEAETRVASAGEHLNDLKARLGGLEERAAEVAEPVGLRNMTPSNLALWTEKHRTAQEAQRKLDRLTRQHRPVLDKADGLLKALGPLLELEAPSFDSAVAAARRLAEEERKHREDVRSASDKLTGLESDLERRQAALARLTAAARQAATAWAEAVESMFDGALNPDVLSNALGKLRDLREQDERRRQAERQVSAMEADQRQFTEAMEELGGKHGIACDDPLETFAQLQGIAARAASDRDRSAQLAEKFATESKRLQQAQRQREDIDRHVREYGALFPDSVHTSTLDALRVAVGKAVEVIEARKHTASLGNQILSELSVADMDAARERLQDTTLAELKGRAASLDTDLERAETHLSETTVARATAAHELAAVTGDADVAALVERKATLQLQIEETALEYLELDLGLTLAEEAIRRYRDKHRSKMMEATERAFSELTNGAYERLTTQPKDASEILLAMDASGTAKQVGDMSKGTRFQLYLALRAAAYEQMVSQGTRLPFFCDDVFETFDEDRTRAACILMERIGRSGQAIYLTHHRHVVEIAREVCTVQPTVHTL